MDAMGTSSINTATTYGNSSTSNNNRSASSSTRDIGVNTQSSAVDTAVQRGRDNRTEERLRESQLSARERQLENVVSRSEDGDTVQVDPTTAELATGSVTARDNSSDAAQALQDKQREDQQRADEIAMKRQERQAEVTSFAGYTTSQIEQLYQQGRISRQDYERQIAIREERTQSTMDSNSASSEQFARLNGTMNRAERDAQAINTAYSDSANQSYMQTAQDRIDAMQRINENSRENQTRTANEGRRQWAYQLQA